jgi:hypothetical protein
MSGPNRVTRILEGLATQAIWQAATFLVSAGFLSLGIAKLLTAAHALATAFYVFLIVVGSLGIRAGGSKEPEPHAGPAHCHPQRVAGQ